MAFWNKKKIVYETYPVKRVCENCNAETIINIPKGMRADSFIDSGNAVCGICGCSLTSKRGILPQLPGAIRKLIPEIKIPQTVKEPENKTTKKTKKTAKKVKEEPVEKETDIFKPTIDLDNMKGGKEIGW